MWITKMEMGETKEGQGGVGQGECWGGEARASDRNHVASTDHRALQGR